MKKILLVNNLRSLLEKERSLLDRVDVKIYSATTSQEALALHKSEKMDLIIADLDMPGISGDRLTTMVRNDLQLKNVAVILVCNDREPDIERVARCKANACLTKPLKPLQLLQKVSQMLDIPERKSYRVLLKVMVHGEKPVNESFFCTSRNISATGLLIETDKRLEKGDRISCSFFLPNSECINADGEVVRLARNPDKTTHYGIRYIDIAPRYRAVIEAFINRRTEKNAAVRSEKTPK